MVNHFHKDCAYYPECKETEDIIKNYKIIRFWCPKLSQVNHTKNGILKGRKYNLGECYDASNGNAYYTGDLHSIKWDCAYFEEQQNTLKLS